MRFFFIRHSTSSLGNIGGSRNYSTANLVAKCKLFLCGKISQKYVNFFDKSSRLLPNCEFFKREVIGFYKAKVSKIFENFTNQLAYNPITAELALLSNLLTAEHRSAL